MSPSSTLTLMASPPQLATVPEKEHLKHHTPTNTFKDTENNNILLDARDAKAPDKWIKRHPELIRLTGKHPMNCEAPVSLLMDQGFITPSSLHYVRNHGPVPNLSWESHQVSISGYVNQAVTLTMNQIEQLPSITLPVTLVCAGNRRKEQNMHKQTKGFNWGPAGISTAMWKGVRVRDLLLNLCQGLQSSSSSSSSKARYVCFEGNDILPNGTYGTSLSIERVMNEQNDVLIAYEMNGQKLTPDHGFPLRLIAPGLIGGRMVKFLTKITVTENESDSWYHYNDNRVLPSQVQDMDQANKEKWFYKPEYILNELNLNSSLTFPAHGDAIPLVENTQNGSGFGGMIELKGYAYNGGGHKVTRVEITLDEGQTWKLTTVNYPEMDEQYRAQSTLDEGYYRQRYWCWSFWKLEISIKELMNCKTICVRAWDASQNMQPKDLNWNLLGMMNNCWFRVKLSFQIARNPENDKDQLMLMFEHPTVAGPTLGGWMNPAPEPMVPLRILSTTASGKPVMATTSDTKILPTPPTVDTSVAVTSKKSAQSLPSPPHTQTTTPTEPLGGTSSGTGFTEKQVALHDQEDDCWIIVDSKVYDCTKFLADHPGGSDSILINAGIDCSEEFDAIHSSAAREMLEKFYIGDLVPEGTIVAAAVALPSQITNGDKPESLTAGSGAGFTEKQVALHDQEDDCWIIVDNKVYDCTRFMADHPGGSDSIMINAGTDCSEEFDAIHSSTAREMLEKYYIGDVVPEGTVTTTTITPATKIPEVVLPPPQVETLIPILDKPDSLEMVVATSSSSGVVKEEVEEAQFLNPKVWKPVRLIEIQHLTHNTRRFRFGLETPTQPLGLPVGKHIFLKSVIDKKVVMRAYTPVSISTTRGYVDVVIKIYFKNVDPLYPEGGIFSQYLDSLELGDESVSVKGPLGGFTYLGQGRYQYNSGGRNLSGTCSQMGMICGGTGLTPLFQVMKEIVVNKKTDKTKFSLVFGNRTVDDILMHADLENLQQQLVDEKQQKVEEVVEDVEEEEVEAHDRFRLWHVLSREKPLNWPFGTGFVTRALLEEHLFPASWGKDPKTGRAVPLKERIVLLCGPPTMINQCCLPLIRDMYGDDFIDNNVFVF